MTALWTIPLYGVPCDVCGSPAAALVVSANARAITHRLKKPCVMANPPKGTPDSGGVVTDDIRGGGGHG